MSKITIQDRKIQKVTHHYKCDECLAVYFAYYPTTDICWVCGKGKIRMVDEPITHKRSC